MNKFTALYVGAIISLVCSLNAQTTQDNSPAPTEFVIVRVLVYSGVPDPCFLITDQKVIEKLFSSLTSLPKNPGLSAQTDSVVPAILGYRGFAIDNCSKQHPEIATVLISGAKVEIWQNQTVATGGTPLPPTKHFLLDVSTAPTEALLFQYAQERGVLKARSVDAIRAQINGARP